MSTTVFQCQAHDRAPLSQRTKTKDGYLLVPGRIAASDNVQPYFAGELGVKGMDAKAVLRVYRPKAEVDAAVSTFDGVPITLGHPPKMLDAKSWKAYTRGEVLHPRVADAGLEADLLIRDERAITAVERKEATELSCAYDFKLTLQKGVTAHGQAYDAVASDLVGNHIAIVRMGRSRTPDGQPCRVADSDKGDRPMRALVFDAALLMSSVPVTLPELDDAAASQVDGLVRGMAQARDEALRQRDAVLDEAAQKLDAQAADHAKQLKELEDGFPARVQAEAMDLANVLAGVTKLGLTTIKTEGKDAFTLRKEVLTEAAKVPARKAVMDAMVPDLTKVDASTAKLVTAALFAMDSAPAAKKAKGHDALGAALAGVKTTTVQATDSAPYAKGRDAMMETSASAWQKKDKGK